MSGGCFDYYRLGSSWLRMLPSMVHSLEHKTVLFHMRLVNPSAEHQKLHSISLHATIFLGGCSFYYFLYGIYFDGINPLRVYELEDRLFCSDYTTS